MDKSDTLVISTQGLSKSYKNIHALKALDLKVHKNSIFGFLGPNGAGKTTTIKLLLGLARPTAGAGRVFGMDIARDSTEIRKRIGYLAQDPRYYEYMTARETLRFTARFFYSGPPARIEARIAETLELVGLSDKADRPIKGFSGGERQRLGIAQAQVNYPDLLILDEPAASLDPQGRRDVLEVVIGIPLALLFGYQLFLGVAPWLAEIMPWALVVNAQPDSLPISVALALEQPLPSTTPVIGALLWSALFVAVALWRFNREEF